MSSSFIFGKGLQAMKYLRAFFGNLLWCAIRVVNFFKPKLCSNPLPLILGGLQKITFQILKKYFFFARYEGLKALSSGLLCCTLGCTIKVTRVANFFKNKYVTRHQLTIDTGWDRKHHVQIKKILIVCTQWNTRKYFLAVF